MMIILKEEELMLHIIILNKDFFPEKLTAKASSKDKVVVIASADGVIPVSAFSNEAFRDMEVKLLPEIKNADSEEGRNMVRLAQAMMIGRLTESEKEYEIYTDDEMLKNAIALFTGSRKTASKRSAKTVAKDSTAPEEIETKAKAKAVRKAKDKKVDIPSKLPSLAQLKKALGAANSGYAKTAHNVMKNSSQITFEMNLRMELAKEGLESAVCQELAKSLNDEFGKMLPVS